jgi:hypothetical protein
MLFGPNLPVETVDRNPGRATDCDFAPRGNERW